jgi:hypothetical protein
MLGFVFYSVISKPELIAYYRQAGANVNDPKVRRRMDTQVAGPHKEFIHFVRSIIRAFSHSLVHFNKIVCSFIHLSVRAFVHSPFTIHSFVHSRVCGSSVHCFVCWFVAMCVA